MKSHIKVFARNLAMNLMIVFMIMIIAALSVQTSDVEQATVIVDETIVESTADDVVQLSNDWYEDYTVTEVTIPAFNRNLSEDDKYLLAKIAMAEAEGESFNTKMLVILVILNRVESSKFPNSIKEVIFQNHKGVYQFSPVKSGGRWWRVEPNEECWEAVEAVNTMEDFSNGALYFEACSGESWHSRNLEFICKSDNTSFYR